MERREESRATRKLEMTGVGAGVDVCGGEGRYRAETRTFPDFRSEQEHGCRCPSETRSPGAGAGGTEGETAVSDMGSFSPLSDIHEPVSSART